MASLRFMSFPSMTHISTELQTPLFSPLLKPHNQSHPISNNLSLSCSLSPPPLSHALTLNPRTKRFRNPFALNLSATSQEQDQAVDSSDDIPRKVSMTRLLLQNIPWDATAEDVRTLLGQYGTVLDVELSMYNKTKNRGLAFVSLSTAEEAQAAFNNIKEFNGRPVLLSYAYHRERKQTVQPKPPSPITFNLFVANLPFNAKSRDLKEFFEAEYDSVYSAEVTYLQNPRRPSGYGFVAFKSKTQSEAALTAFEGKVFMGRPLRLQRSKKYVRERKKEEGVEIDDSLAELKSDTNQVEEN